MSQAISTSFFSFNKSVEFLPQRLGFKIPTQQTTTPMFVISDLLKKTYSPPWTVSHDKPAVLDLLTSRKTAKHIIKCIIQNEKLKSLYNDLNNLHKECKEDGFDLIDEKAVENARIILKIVHTDFPNHEYHIYPTENREVAIGCNPQKGKGILILCDSLGGMAYFATLNGKNSRFRCDNRDDFPSEQLLQTFKAMQSDGNYEIKRKSQLMTSHFRPAQEVTVHNHIYRQIQQNDVT